MADVIALPLAPRDDRGTIHVWAQNGLFEIGHESCSGNSWGHFETFYTAEQAIVAAHALNRDVLDSGCDVDIAPPVLDACSSPSVPRGAF